MHSHRDILNLCREHKEEEWFYLETIVKDNTRETKYRILASAVFESYHDDTAAKRKNGLKANWGKNHLSTGKQRFFVAAFFDNSADLTDFYLAYIIAKYELADPVIADKIKTHIQANQHVLGKLLESYILPEAMKADICAELDLNINLQQLPIVPPNSPCPQYSTSDQPDTDDEIPRYNLRTRPM